jgi:hypothetical protein
MDQDAISLWLKENGLRVLTRPMPPADGPVLAGMDNTESPSPTTVADLDLVDPEDRDDVDPEDRDDVDPEDHDDDHNCGADDDCLRVTVDQRDRPGRWENTELVAAAFQAAGNPTYQDVRLKSPQTSHCPGPTHREIAVERATRLSRSVTW